MAETHLLKSDILQLSGYRWFGSNRRGVHVRAKRGSGGVGFFVKDELCQNFDVSLLDRNFDGIFMDYVEA